MGSYILLCFALTARCAQSCASKNLVVTGTVIIDSSTGTSTVGLGEYRRTTGTTAGERPVSVHVLLTGE
jgi:hypothetical protein